MKTLLFLLKSLKENLIILKQEQKWFVAVIVLIVSVVASVSGTLYTGYTSNVNNVINTSSDASMDSALISLGKEINDQNNLIIENGTLTASGIFNKEGQTNLTENSNNSIIEPNFTATHSLPNYSDSGEITGYTDQNVLYVYSFPDFDSNAAGSNAIFTAFINKSIYKLSSTNTSDKTWTPTSFIVFTKHSVYMETYKVVNRKSTDSAIGTASGIYNSKDYFNFKDMFTKDGSVLPYNEISSNLLVFLNSAYAAIRIPYTWMQVGIYAAVTVGVIFLAGVVLWLVTRRKKLLDDIKITFWKAQKIAYFESLTPALVGFIFSFFLSQYAVFITLIVLSLRISSSVTKLTNLNRPTDDSKPIYKARS